MFVPANSMELNIFMNYVMGIIASPSSNYLVKNVGLDTEAMIKAADELTEATVKRINAAPAAPKSPGILKPDGSGLAVPPHLKLNN